MTLYYREPSTRRCPISGCERQMGFDQIMCREHWYQVPKGQRDRIWQLYEERPGSDAHRAAVFKAIRYVLELRSSREVQA